MSVSFYKFSGGIIYNELFIHAWAFWGFCISGSEIANSDALWTVVFANPIGIRKVDTNGCTRVEVAA